MEWMCNDDYYAGICPARTRQGHCTTEFGCRHRVCVPRQVVTNGDKIRAMGDKELAEFLYTFFWGRKAIRLLNLEKWLQDTATDMKG